MAVGTETEVDEVEHRRRSCELPQSQGVLRGCGLQVRRFHGHGMDLLRVQGGMLKQAFAQVREVSVQVSVWSHTLVDLTYMYTYPRDIFPRQRPQHEPRS